MALHSNAAVHLRAPLVLPSLVLPCLVLPCLVLPCRCCKPGHSVPTTTPQAQSPKVDKKEYVGAAEGGAVGINPRGSS